MIHGLSSIEFNGKFCEECLLGKQSRTSFMRSVENQAKEKRKF